MPGTQALLVTILRALEDNLNVLLYGPPGTGKSYLMSLVQRSFLEPGPLVVLNEQADTDFFDEVPLHDRPCREAWWITFHQSYSYEDFVVGLRTVPGTGFQLEPVHGPLLEAAEHARLPGGSSLLLIDEINRGNTSRIFGEFITTMESPKRSAPDGSRQPETVDVRLPYISAAGLAFSPNWSCQNLPATLTISSRFTMPHHVYLLASMNTVDRSVAPLDAALRRRFYVVELQTDYELLCSEFGIAGSLADWGTLASTPNDLEYWRKLTVRLLYRLNARIRTLVGDDFQLGHAYLLPLAAKDTVPDLKQSLKETLERRLIPQLQEMLRGNQQALAAALVAAEADQDLWYPYRQEPVPEELEMVSAAGGVRVDEIDLASLEKIVRRLGNVKQP